MSAVPANRVRSIMRVFASDVEDKAWFRDRDEWSRYLDFMAENQWSRVQLAFGLSYDFPRRVRDSYLYFAYPFLLDVPGFSVRATNLPAAERDANLETLRWISDACAARSLDFQLGLWTHQYQLFESPDVNHTIEGLDDESHAPYCRAAVAELLRSCPSVTGVTLRVHGESGIAEGSHDFWAEVFAGVAECGRRVGIDLHSKGIEQPLIDRALATGLPVTISPKYWAEHMGPPYHQAAIRPLEQADVTESHGGGRGAGVRLGRGVGKPGSWESGYMNLSTGERRFTRYGYADLMREDRRYGIVFRIWPGTQRLLLWGDPAMAAGYGRFGSFCGADGVELFEPLSFKGRRGSGLAGPRSGYEDEALRHPEGDWAKYKRTYRLFGRLLFNPDASADEWRSANLEELGADGEAGSACERALAYASRILPLVTAAHLPSAANNTFWPELYTNQPIVDEQPSTRAAGAQGVRGPGEARHPYSDTPAPKLFTHVSPLDPQLFTNADQFAGEVIGGEWTGKCSPLDVARRLDALAASATAEMHNAAGFPAARQPAAFRRLSHDVRIVCAVGRAFAARMRAAVGYALFRRTGSAASLDEAIDALTQSIATWRAAVDAAAVYVDDLTFGPEQKLRGHWRDRSAAMEADLADLNAARDRAGTAANACPSLDALETPLPTVPAHHERPPAFSTGRTLTLTCSAGAPTVRLHYRHVNQAGLWQSVEMTALGGENHAEIPAMYTASPYPLQYYFEVRPAAGRPWLYPGLDEDLSNQPYFVIRSTAP